MKTRQDRDERKILWTVCACWAHRDSGCALSFKGIKVTEVCMVESVGDIRAAGLEKGGKHGCAHHFGICTLIWSTMLAILGRNCGSYAWPIVPCSIIILIIKCARSQRSLTCLAWRVQSLRGRVACQGWACPWSKQQLLLRDVVLSVSSQQGRV